MREILSHGAGRIFILILVLTVLGLFAITPWLSKPVLIFGWMSLPFVVGIVFVLIWLCAYVVYFFRYWPFR